jgi:glycosyltransferase involved in cell wall biosynthesis
MEGADSKRVHLMMITDEIGVGGAEQVVLDLSESIDPVRFRRTVCLTRSIEACDPSDEFHSLARAEQLRSAGVQLIELGRQSRANLWAWPRLLRFMRSEKVAIVHSHKFGSNFWGAVTGALTRTPVVIAHEHTWSFEGQPMRRVIDRSTSRIVDAMIAVSEPDRQKMIEIVGIRPDRVVYIPNGVRPPRQGDGRAVRHAEGIPDDAPVLVSVGNLRAQKAYDVMLEALAIVLRDFPDVRLLIAGGGGQAESLRALAGRLGIDDSVSFLGVRGDVPDVLAAADIAVTSSDFEGSPLAAMEYLGAGLPVVATNVGGMPELVIPKLNGTLVPRRDPAALAAAICELIANPHLAREMGEKGRLRHKTEFSLDAMVARIEALYADLLASKLSTA